MNSNMEPICNAMLCHLIVPDMRGCFAEDLHTHKKSEPCDLCHAMPRCNKLLMIHCRSSTAEHVEGLHSSTQEYDTLIERHSASLVNSHRCATLSSWTRKRAVKAWVTEDVCESLAHLVPIVKIDRFVSRAIFKVSRRTFV